MHAGKIAPAGTWAPIWVLRYVSTSGSSLVVPSPFAIMHLELYG